MNVVNSVKHKVRKKPKQLIKNHLSPTNYETLSL